MRHQKKTVKLGRTAEHRKALLANQVCSLIEHSRIKTTLAKAKAVRPFAEKMLTLGKRGSLHDRRNAISYLHQPKMVKKLFEEIAPRSAGRSGGYTRIIKLGPRQSDSAQMAYIEWVDLAPAPDDLAPKQVGAPAKEEAPPTAAEPKAPKAKKVPAEGAAAPEKERRFQEGGRQGQTRDREVAQGGRSNPARQGQDRRGQEGRQKEVIAPRWHSKDGGDPRMGLPRFFFIGGRRCARPTTVPGRFRGRASDHRKRNPCRAAPTPRRRPVFPGPKPRPRRLRPR